VYRTVKEYFAHWEGLPAGYDFDQQFRTYLAEALSAPDRRAFSLATMRLVASLGNGHTGFTDQAFYQDQRPAPFYAEPVQGRWTVTVSRTPGLAPGDVIESIDGAPIETWVEPIRAIIGQSSPRARDHLVFLRRFMLPQRFVLRLDDGRRVPVSRDGPFGPRLGSPQHDDVTVQRRADGVVVIGIPDFGDPHLEAHAVKAVQAAAGAPLIVLDVRGNTGGSTPRALLRAIMTRPYEGTVAATPLIVAENDANGSFSPEDNPAPNAALRYGPDRSEPDADAYRGPIALLVDRQCESACEDLVIRFKSGGRGLILGEPTWGSTGQPIQVNFPDLGMSLHVSTKRESFPDGARFEGVGVQPDIAIPLTRADVSASSDTVLERAVHAALSEAHISTTH
jgi:carboxyl-terminal processing protease